MTPMLVVWVSVVAAAFAGLIARPGTPGLEVYACAGVGLVAYHAIWFLITRDIRKIGILMVLTMTFAFYLLPLLREDFASYYRYSYTREALAESARYATIGMFAISLGWTWGSRLRIPPLLHNMQRREVPLDVLAQLAFWMSILALVSVVFEEFFWELRYALGRLAFLIDQLPMLALACAAVARFSGYRSILFSVWMFGVFLPVSVLLIVAHTLMYHAFLLLAPLFMIYVIKTRKIPWVYAIVAYLVLFPAFKGRIDARKEFGWGYQYSLVERVEIGLERVFGAWTAPESSREEFQDQLAAERLNALSLLAHCVHFHEENGKPYKYGATFWWLPLSPIPRIIFPWKPNNDHGDTFGLEYNLKEPGTSFAVVLPLMVESYINGGLAGIIAINILIGLMYYACFALFQHGRGTVNLICLGSVVYFIMYVENNITMLFGGALQAIMFWFVIDRLVFRQDPARMKARTPLRLPDPAPTRSVEAISSSRTS